MWWTVIVWGDREWSDGLKVSRRMAEYCANQLTQEEGIPAQAIPVPWAGEENCAWDIDAETGE